jgi:hypothetical protein
MDVTLELGERPIVTGVHRADDTAAGDCGQYTRTLKYALGMKGSEAAEMEGDGPRPAAG